MQATTSFFLVAVGVLLLWLIATGRGVNLSTAWAALKGVPDLSLSANRTVLR